MPTITAEQYVAELFVTNHSGHTQTKRAGADGTVHIMCSCGVTLVLAKDVTLP